MKLVARLPIAPMHAVRMTQRSKWRDAPRKYLEWKRALAWTALAAKYELRSGDRIVFKISLPKAQRQVTAGDPHTVKPDLDNLLKAFFDALHTDDAHISEISARKEWAETGEIEVWRTVTNPRGRDT